MQRLFASLILALVCISASPVLRAQILTAEPLDRIAAVVEDDVILRSELDAAINNVLAQYANNPQKLPPRDVLETQVLERLVMLRLQVQRGSTTGIRVSDAETEQAMQRVADSNKATLAQMRASLEAQGLSFDEFRKTLREQLIVQKLQQRIVQSRVNVTDAEVDTLLASGGGHKGELHIANILISVPDGASPEAVQIARDKAEKVRKEIDGGMDFAAAAIRYSDGQNALEGGDLGWRRHDEVPEAFVDLVQNLSPGEITRPVRGPSGFHILKLVDKREQGKQVVAEYHARHIMFKMSEVVTSEDAQKKVRAARKRITDGEDFAKVAKEVSQDGNSANQGGDMGWFQAEQYGPMVGKVIVSLKDDQISEPFQTDLGWHILQRLGERNTDRTNDMAREQARDTLRNRKAEDEYETFLRQLRAESFVDVRLPGAAKPDKTEAAETVK
ncbi:hypothetical protein ELE36_05720 [Pseudolysobacter antarcticus]|uniref:Chaperone SurA n=1 Tax=Pseudolysobacter antarcticus TaxID=2511995 RepID=A0A411HHC6_9GAMM|nr:peptidylprolyl isomerase [Pseudolysobacter antarcticus]QBB69903.1 hypothetical protein ELE36_05720 [Pseudolysobacter antarcticus]